MDSKSNQTYFDTVPYGSEDDDLDNVFQSDNPVGFVPEVLNGVNFVRENGEEVSKKGLIDSSTLFDCAKRPRVITPLRLEISNNFND